MFRHLTNFAINKKNPDFISSNTQARENQKAHKRSLKDLFKEMKGKGIPTNKIWRQISQIVGKSVSAIQPYLKHFSCLHTLDVYSQGCFQVLGFDVMIDEDHKCHLLEVNHNSSYRTGSLVDKKVKGSLIQDVIQLIWCTNDLKARMTKLEKRLVKQRITQGTIKKEELTKIKQKYVAERDKWSSKNLGGFEQIYPPNKQSSYLLEKYDSIMKESEKMNFGVNISNIRFLTNNMRMGATRINNIIPRP